MDDQVSLRNIPRQVWRLLDEIMDYGKPVQMFDSATERSRAYSMAWFCDPPLLKEGTSTLTKHGLVMYELRQQWLIDRGAETTDTGIVLRCSRTDLGDPNDVDRETKDLNNDAYLPIGNVWREQFATYALAKAFLKNHPEIRTRKPSKNRLEVHAADWLKHFSRKDDDLTDEEIATILEKQDQERDY